MCLNNHRPINIILDKARILMCIGLSVLATLCIVKCVRLWCVQTVRRILGRLGLQCVVWGAGG